MFVEWQTEFPAVRAGEKKCLKSTLFSPARTAGNSVCHSTNIYASPFYGPSLLVSGLGGSAPQYILLDICRNSGGGGFGAGGRFWGPKNFFINYFINNLYLINNFINYLFIYNNFY